jgi:histidine ammonia-lyase
VWQPCTQGVNGALNACPRDHDSHPTQPYRPDSGTVALITLGGHQDLTREAVEAVAWGGERLALTPEALERVAAGRAELLALLAGGTRVYGVNTGMGWLASVGLDEAAQAGHQRNLLLGRAVGGPPWLPVAAPEAAEKLRRVEELARELAACELLAARQAWWLRRAAPAAGLRGIAARLAELAAPVDRDRPLGGDLATIVAALERDEPLLP